MERVPKTIGILALQGGFQEHATMLNGLGVEVRLIRSLADTEGLSACILPGGESTAISNQLIKTGLDAWLKKAVTEGMPVFGTCAGAIILSQTGLIDVSIERNAYGSQLDSFEADLDVSRFLDRAPFRSVFIRAPRIARFGQAVESLAQNNSEAVCLKQKNVLVTTFHPELTRDNRIHKYFLSLQ